MFRLPQCPKCCREIAEPVSSPFTCECGRTITPDEVVAIKAVSRRMARRAFRRRAVVFVAAAITAAGVLYGVGVLP